MNFFKVSFCFFSSRSARKSDQGLYQCSAENAAGERITGPARVRVMGEFAQSLFINVSKQKKTTPFLTNADWDGGN